MFGRKKQDIPRSSVLIPLYVYPSPGAWDPLFTAISSHPKLNFIVVVNPNSGPGSDPLPDGNYTREIPRLNSHANVQTVGYVSTSYGKRDLTTIVKEVNIYSAWAGHGLMMHGIFLDETPSVYNFSAARTYERLATEIRSGSGFGSTPLIIHNPGTIPDARYLTSCNMSVVFEGTHSTFQQYGLGKTIKSFLAAPNCDRDHVAVIVHSLPPALSEKDKGNIVKDYRKLAAGIFVTGLSVDYYASFSRDWGDFVKDMDS